MSVKIGQTIVIKVNQKEYELILFIREKMRYGKCILITKDGRPIRIEKATESILFGNGNKKEAVDKFSEKAQIPLKTEET